eukprot:9499507-Pyramimonas_sp.AAC.1
MTFDSARGVDAIIYSGEGPQCESTLPDDDVDMPPAPSIWGNAMMEPVHVLDSPDDEAPPNESEAPKGADKKRSWSLNPDFMPRAKSDTKEDDELSSLGLGHQLTDMQ